MVRNKSELVTASNAWLDVAQNDIRKHTLAFMEAARIDENVLADILDTDVEIIHGIVNGTCDIPLSVFAKILIATNHCIVVQPLDPRGNMRNMPPMHNMPRMPRMGANPRPTAPQQNNRNTNGCPARDSRGRFVSRNNEQPIAPFPMPNMGGQLPSPEELMDANMRGWNTPCPDDFIDEEAPIMPTPEGPNCSENRTENRRVEDNDETLVPRIARMLQQNPEVVNLLKSLLRNN